MLAVFGLTAPGTVAAQTVNLSLSHHILLESAGATSVTVTATLSAAQSTATTVTLSLAGTATKDTDYTVSGTQSITIAANATSDTTTLTITPTDDSDDTEGSETIIVNGTITSSTITVNSATLTLVDDEREQDKAALIALYNATGGANWTTTWDTSTEHIKVENGQYIPNWSGLRINGSTRRVTRVELKDKNLTGTLPPELNSLTELRVLDLSRNNLTGPIPALSALTNLTELNLYYNRLTGSVPDIGTLSSNLEILYLDYNLLTGPVPVPADLTSLSTFRSGFWFDYNETACLPDNTAFVNWYTGLDQSASDTVRVHCNLDAPTASPSLTPGPGSITVTWTAESDRTNPTFTVSHYEVQWRHCTDSQCTNAGKWSPHPHENEIVYYRPPSTTTTYTISLADLTPGDPHQVRYRVLDETSNRPPEKYNGTKWSQAASATVPAVTLSAHFAQTTATLAIDKWPHKWWYKGNQTNAACTAVAAGTAGADLTGLTASTAYTYTAYRDKDCSTATEMDDVSFTTLTTEPSAPTAPTLTAAATGGQLTVTGMTAPTNFTTDSYEVRYRQCPTAQCTNTATWLPVPGKSIQANATPLTVAFTTELTPNQYYKVRYRALDVDDSDSNKYTASLWSATSTAVLVPAATLTYSKLSTTGATLTLGKWPHQWWYKGNQTGAPCTPVAAGTSTATLSGLIPNKSYTYSAYRVADCTGPMASATFETDEDTLTAGNITATGATLTLTHYAQ